MRRPWAWRRWELTLAGDSERRVGGGEPDVRVCLVHVVRRAYGLEAFRGFVDAWRAHPAGVEHELVLALKGFGSVGEAAPFLDLVGDLDVNVLFFPDVGMDLGVYFAVAARLRRERYCFVNSYARPLVDGWLAKLDAALDRPGVGQVGATGSWSSMHSWLAYSLGLPSAYRQLLPSRRITREQLLAIQLEWEGVQRRSLQGAARARRQTLIRVPQELCDFPPFPTPHLRPNSFMVRHEVLRELRLFLVRNKMDTYVLESSSDSITCQLERLGLTSLVVDRDGGVFGRDRWDRSLTFWQGDQQGLLVADKQTSGYEAGGSARRRVLSSLAWGLQAAPRAGEVQGALGLDPHAGGAAVETDGHAPAMVYRSPTGVKLGVVAGGG